MPELPEVESLSRFLGERLVGRSVARVYPVSIHALKTYDPPVSALDGRRFDDVTRHGKFLDLRVGGLHLVMHLARAGWVRWSDRLPEAPPRPGKGPLALRVRLGEPDDGAGFEVTEAGTQKHLAVYVVRDPLEVPGIARLGPDPLSADFTAEAFAGLLAGEGRQIKGVLRDQSVIAGIGNAYSDEILHAARMSPFKLAAKLSGEEVARLYEAIGTTLAAAVERSQGLALKDLKAEKKSGLRVHGRKGRPVRCAGTRFVRCRSVIRRCSTAPPARPGARCLRTGGCRGC